MSTLSTPLSNDRLEASDVAEHDRSANGLSQNRPVATPTISLLSGRSSPRRSFDEQSNTIPAIEEPARYQSLRNLSLEPQPDLASASSATAGPTGNPNTPHSSFEPVSIHPGWNSTGLARTERPNAQPALIQMRRNLPFMGTFSVPDDEVRDTMKRLSEDLESAVRQLFMSVGVKIGYPAEFEPAPVSELKRLYESALGTKDWRSRADELRVDGPLRAFDLLIALVGVAVHRWVLSDVHGWQGPVQEYLGSERHRRHLDCIQAQYGAISELQDPEYESEEVRPEARRLSGNLKLALAQHLDKIFGDQPEAFSHALGKQWSNALTDLFAGALLLKARLSLASEEYAFAWPSGKEPFLEQNMKSRYISNKQSAFGQVVVTLWSGVAVTDDDVGMQLVSRAYVIAA
ncbi:hypothetical protein KC315_g6318 [Hortaea werneckii]|nr:hypothetical protein KC315_g6318 [Hortaea werneckii]KAI7364086.1 hypothetical protein KC354_g5971 [Hortaea werneckii]